jgi:outer membrane protein OmpA-like peptidoglycan-associated protein
MCDGFVTAPRNPVRVTRPGPPGRVRMRTVRPILSSPAAAAAGLALAAVLACASASPRASAPPDEPGDATLLHAAELARVKCLLVAPFENASDAPLADAATTAVLSGVDGARTKVYPVQDLRALFHDTPLELPEGVSPSLALELAELLGADAALYGSVEGRARGSDSALVVNVRLSLSAHRDLLFAASAPVRAREGERIDAAVRRTLLETAQPMLARLGDPGRKRCFDLERTKALRALAVAQGRAALPPPPAPPAPAVQPTALAQAPAARTQTRTPRQGEWAKKLGAAARFVAEDVAFAARTAQLQRDAGLADLAVALAAAPDVKARLEAFVDSTNDPEKDAKLSGAMAQAAVQRLVDLGISRDRLSWAGRGGESPLLPNFTARGRAANRRVEVVGLH